MGSQFLYILVIKDFCWVSKFINYKVTEILSEQNIECCSHPPSQWCLLGEFYLLCFIIISQK